MFEDFQYGQFDQGNYNYDPQAPILSQPNNPVNPAQPQKRKLSDIFKQILLGQAMGQVNQQLPGAPTMPELGTASNLGRIAGTGVKQLFKVFGGG